MRMRDIFLGFDWLYGSHAVGDVLGPVFVVRDCWRYLQTGNWYEL